MDKLMHLKHLDESMDYLTAYSMHVAKALLMVDDMDKDGDSDEDTDQDGMREMYKDHMDTLMEMADNIKTCRVRLQPDSMYEKKAPDYYSLTKEATVIKEVPAQLTEQVSKITGKSELNEQLGVLMALKDTISRLDDQNKQLQTENKGLKEKLVDQEKLSLVEESIRKKKLFPSQKAWALSAPMDLLKSYLAVTPEILQTEKVEEQKIDTGYTSEIVSEFKKLFYTELKAAK